MRRLSANYIFPISSPPLKNGIIEIDDNGKILNIINTGGHLQESQNLEFFNGVLVPGFINTHCHLELSYLKNKIQKNTGLVNFVADIRRMRDNSLSVINDINIADKLMWQNGIVACGDISNSDVSFDIKSKSKIFYYNFIEVFGLDYAKNKTIIDNAKKLLSQLYNKNLRGSIVPHSTYSLNNRLLNEINKLNKNSIISIHNQETESENSIFVNNNGELYNYFKTFSNYKFPKTGQTSIKSINLNKNTKTLFVHNTFSTFSDINFISKNFTDFYFGFCPSSNLYIENKLPDFSIFKNFTDKITIGTDSLASNTSLDILNEIKIITENYNFSINELFKFATLNGAKFLNISNNFGSFDTGKTPGINLISFIDFKNMRLTKQSKVKKII